MAKAYGERVETALDSRLNIRNEYGVVNKSGFVPKLKARFEPYKYVRHPEYLREIMFKIYGGISLTGSEIVADIGSSRGDTLNQIFIQQLGHKGLLLGIDVNEAVIRKGKQEYPSINFLKSNAMCLGLRDNSVDLTISLFTLYHMKEVRKAIEEMRRVTKKPDGHAIFGTSGIGNKRVQRHYQGQVADHLGVTHPIDYADPFEATKADRYISDAFSVLYHGHQADETVFDLDNINSWFGSLATMYPTCRDKQTGEKITKDRWLTGIREVVVDEVLGTIRREGEFVDYVDRHFWQATPLELAHAA